VTIFERILREIETLKPISASIPRLAAAVSDPNANLATIVRTIEYDPVLTANALRLANSAYYAPASGISTVREAVERLGAGRILQFAAGQFAKQQMSRKNSGYELAENELWRHSVASATAVDQMARVSAVRVPAAAFSAALLHDVGKLVLGRIIEEDLRERIFSTIERKHLSYVEAELEVLGVDHAQVGGSIARRWSFPHSLADAIRWHHSPEYATSSDLAANAVHVGNAVAKILGIGMGTEQMNAVARATAARNLGLNSRKLESLCAAVAEALPSILSLYEEV